MRTTTWPILAVSLSLATSAYGGQEPSSPPASNDAATQREDELRRRVVQDFRDEVVGSKVALTSLQDAVQELDSRLKELLTNEAGKRVASDPLSVMTFLQIRDEPSPTTDQVAKKREAVEAIQTSVEARLKRPRIEDLPAPQQRRDVLDAYSWAKAKMDRVSDRLDSLDGLIASTPAKGDVSKGPTLDAAVKEYKNRFSRFLNEGWQRGEAKAAEHAQQTMIDAGEKAALEQAAMKAKLESEKLTAENNRLKSEHEAEIRRLYEQNDQKVADLGRELAVAKAARLKQEAETTVIAKKGEEDAAKILKRKRCEDPEVKALLASFLAEGYRQPGQGEPTIDKQPMSLSALRSYGALERTVLGLSQLTDVLRRYEFDDPDRPSMPFPNGYRALSGTDMEKVKKIQSLLNELGDTMVELKMLAP